MVSKQAAENAKLASSAAAVSAAQTKQAITTKAVTTVTNEQALSIQRLQLRLDSYKSISEKTFDPVIRQQYNQKIQQTTAEIQRMSNVGKAGFDEMGNAVKRSGNYITKGIQGILRLAYLLPGIGVAGLLAFAIDPIVNYISKLDIFNKKASQAKENMYALNEVNEVADKEAGKQISTLKVLYTAATNVNLSMKDRTKAADELKKQFPDAFVNSKTQAILNGKEAASFKKLTEEILQTARAKAAKDKLDEIEAKRLDIAIQKEKIRNANAAENHVPKRK